MQCKEEYRNPLRASSLYFPGVFIIRYFAKDKFSLPFSGVVNYASMYYEPAHLTFIKSIIIPTRVAVQ